MFLNFTFKKNKIILINFYFFLKHTFFNLRKIIFKTLFYKKNNIDNLHNENLNSLKKNGFVKIKIEDFFEYDDVNHIINEAELFLNNIEKNKEFNNSISSVDSIRKNFKLIISNHFSKDKIEKILFEKNLTNFVKNYFNTDVFLRDANVWWDIHTEENAKSSQLFHIDGDDPILLKFFLYLSNVDHDDGPFVFVKKTHKYLKKSLLILKNGIFNVDASKFNIDDICYFYGKPGDLFLVDTNGFHKGLKPNNNSKGRILLYAQFCSRNPLHEKIVKESLFKFVKL